MSKDAAAADELVPDPVLQRELNICAMSLWRWTRDTRLAFPRAVKIRNRNYRLRCEIEAWKTRMMRSAIEGRAAADNGPAKTSPEDEQLFEAFRAGVALAQGHIPPEEMLRRAGRSPRPHNTRRFDDQ
jgi:predicted DNA-binding transcriptional regulator AlpA